MAYKNKMDWMIWAKKVGKQIAIVFLAGLASVYGDNQLYLMLIPAIHGLENYLKHK